MAVIEGNSRAAALRESISFTTSREDLELIYQIAVRAVGLAKELGINYQHEDAMMDLSVTHASGCRLNLQALLDADDGNFGHDVFGIRKHVNHETGKLKGFRPRCQE